MNKEDREFLIKRLESLESEVSEIRRILKSSEASETQSEGLAPKEAILNIDEKDKLIEKATFYEEKLRDEEKSAVDEVGERSRENISKVDEVGERSRENISKVDEVGERSRENISKLEDKEKTDKEDSTKKDVKDESVKTDEQLNKEHKKIADDPFKNIKSSKSSDFRSNNINSSTNKQQSSDSSKQFSDSPKQSSESKEPKSNNYIEFIKKFFLMASIILILVCGSLFLALYAKSNLLKLVVIMCFSIIMTSWGFNDILKGKKNVVSYFMTGVGSGLALIAILASHLAFHFIDSTSMLVLAGLWSWSFIYSYRYTKMFFVVAIAYAGALFAAFSGIGLVFDKTAGNYWVVYFYLLFTGIYIDYFSKKYMTLNECKVVNYMNLLSGFSLIIFALDDREVNSAISALFIVLSFCFILRDTFKKENNLFLIFVSVFLVLGFSLFGIINFTERLNLSWAYACIMYFVLNAYIFISAHEFAKYKHLILILTALASGIFVSILFGVKYHLIGGMSVFMIIPAIFDIKNEKKQYIYCIYPFLVIDLFLFFHNLYYSHTPDVFVFLLYISINLYILFSIFNKSHFYRFLVFATIELIVAVFLMTYVGDFLSADSHKRYDFFDFFDIDIYAPISTIFSVFSSCFIASLAIFGWFKDWNNTDSQGLKAYVKSQDSNSSKNFTDFAEFNLLAFDRFKKFCEGKFDYLNDLIDVQYLTLFNIIFFAHFIMAIICICGFSVFYNILFIFAFSSALLYLQSCVILKFFKKSIWICGLEGFLLFWISIMKLFGLEFVSPFMSLVGFIFGFLCVYIGFNIKAESLRILGLSASVLMIVKFVIFDSFLGYSDVILARLIATGIGGLCCFGITWVYGKLEKIEREKEKIENEKSE